MIIKSPKHGTHSLHVSALEGDHRATNKTVGRTLFFFFPFPSLQEFLVLLTDCHYFTNVLFIMYIFI